MRNTDKLLLQAYTNIADVYELKGEYETAIGFYQKIISRFNRKFESVIRIAEIHEKMSKYDEALQELKKIEKNASRRNRKDRLHLHILKGWLLTNKGMLTEAEVETDKAGKLLKGVDNNQYSDEISSVFNINAEIQYFKGNYKGALQNYEMAVKHINQKDFLAVSILKSNMAKIHYELREYEKAKECMEYRLEVSKKTGDKRGEGLAYGGIANILFDMGKYPDSLDYYKRNLDIADYLQDVKSQGMVIGNIANVYYVTGKYDDALKYYTRSLELLENIGHKKSIGIGHCNLGNVYLYKGMTDKALEHYQILYDISEELNDTMLLAHAHSCMGNTAVEKGRYKDAVKHYQENLSIMKQVSNKIFSAESYISLGNAYMEMKDFENAERFLNESMKIAEETGSDEHRRITVYNLGKTALGKGNIELAKNYLDFVEKYIEEQLTTPEERLEFYLTYASYYLLCGKRAQAYAYTETAMREADKLQSALFRGKAYYAKARLLSNFEDSNSDDAEQYYLKAVRLFEKLESIPMLARTCESYSNYLEDKNRKESNRMLAKARQYYKQTDIKYTI